MEFERGANTYRYLANVETQNSPRNKLFVGHTVLVFFTELRDALGINY